MKRLYIGGLSHTITQKDLRDRFGKFGTVEDVELRTRRDDDGVPYKTFGYINISISDNDFKKCMTVLNKSKWKGGTLQIEPAKESFLQRLDQERQALTKDSPSAPLQDPKAKLLDSLRSAGVENFHMKAAVPGTEVPGHKEWVVSKFGRVLPVLNLRCGRGSKTRSMKYDPSKHSHNIKKLELDPFTTSVAQLTWELQGGDDDISKKRRGEFPPTQPWRPKRMKTAPSPTSAGGEQINGLAGGYMAEAEVQSMSQGALGLPVEEDIMEVVREDFLVRSRKFHKGGGKEEDYDSADTDELLASNKPPPSALREHAGKQSLQASSGRDKKRSALPLFQTSSSAEDEEDDDDDTDDFKQSDPKVDIRQQSQTTLSRLKPSVVDSDDKVGEVESDHDEEADGDKEGEVESDHDEEGDVESDHDEEVESDHDEEGDVESDHDEEGDVESDSDEDLDYDAIFSNCTKLEISLADLQRLAKDADTTTPSMPQPPEGQAAVGGPAAGVPSPGPKKGTTPEEILASLLKEDGYEEEKSKRKKRSRAVSQLPAFQGTGCLLGHEGSGPQTVAVEPEPQEEQEAPPASTQKNKGWKDSVTKDNNNSSSSKEEEDAEEQGGGFVVAEQLSQEPSSGSSEEEEEEEEEEVGGVTEMADLPALGQKPSSDSSEEEEEEEDEEEEEEEVSGVTKTIDLPALGQEPSSGSSEEEEEEVVEVEVGGVMKTIDLPALGQEPSSDSSEEEEEDEEEEEEEEVGGVTKTIDLPALGQEPSSDSSEEEEEDDEEEGQKVTRGPARTLDPERQRLDNKRRLQAVVQRHQETQNQRSLIQGALASLDSSAATPGQHIVFGSDEEEEPENAAAPANSKAPLREKDQKVSGSKLFDEEEDEEEGDGDRFLIKPQFEGRAGRKLMAIQAGFGIDERFRMDSRFAESDEEEEEEERGAAGEVMKSGGEEEEGLEEEKKMNLSILQSVLNNNPQLHTKPKTSSKTHNFRDVQALHYDPSRQEHAVFEDKMEDVAKEGKASRKRKKQKEAELPEVSREIYYDVCDDLKGVFGGGVPGGPGGTAVPQEASCWDRLVEEQEKMREDEQTETKEEQSAFKFSFFQEETQASKETEYRVEAIKEPRVSWQLESGFHDSSSDDDDDDDNDDAAADGDEEKVKQSSCDPAEESVMPSYRELFFYYPEDSRLTEGPRSFCRSSQLKENDWEEKRNALIQDCRNTHKKARRKCTKKR